MRLFVTGAAGFLGQRVVSRLLQDGHRVRCLVRSDLGSKTRILKDLPGAANRLELTYGSLQECPDLDGALRACDRVVHIAAAVKGSAPTLFLDTVVGTRALVSATLTARVERFVLVSSIAVYATQPLPQGAELDESCPLDPKPHLRDPYTYSKIVQEEVCSNASRTADLPLVIIRPGVIYGPGRPVITNRVGLSIGRTLVQMGGRHRLPYTYVENCADAIVLAATVEKELAGAYNIVDDDLPTGRLLVRLCREHGQNIRVIPVPRPLISAAVTAYEWYSKRTNYLLPGVLTRYRADAQWRPLVFGNQRAKRELGWRPALSTATALRATLRLPDPAHAA